MAIEDKERLSALLALYSEQATHGRHTESQRSTIGTILLGASGALVGLMGTMRFSIYCFAPALFLIWLGRFGKSFVQIYEDKWDETKNRRRFYREEVHVLIGKKPVTHALKKERLRHAWQKMFDGVVIVGIICALITLAAVVARSFQVNKSWTQNIVYQLIDEPKK